MALAAMMASRGGARIDASPGSLLLVVHDFVARSADELSLAKGDRIELIERDDDFGDGWFLGRHMANGSTGLFPEGALLSLLLTVLPSDADEWQSTPRQHPKAPSLRQISNAASVMLCPRLLAEAQTRRASRTHPPNPNRVTPPPLQSRKFMQ